MKSSIPNVTPEELKVAFKKLQAYSYFDNYDLILREKIAEFKLDLENNLASCLERIQNEEPLRTLFSRDRFGITFFPKKVNQNTPSLPQSFYTNTRLEFSNEITKPLLFADFPVEFHLISVIWLTRYGKDLEHQISKSSFGNRLIIDREKNNVPSGRALFKPYVKQFQKWWSTAISETKALLEKGNNVTIINFDLHSFYNSIRFDFKDLEDEFSDMAKDPLHKTFVRIHVEYAALLKDKSPSLNDGSNGVPLPIGFLSSHVLANWYLRKLDPFIEKDLRPVYYGRYVDDFIIVVKDTILSAGEINSNMNTSSQGGATDVTLMYLTKYFSNIFKVGADNEIALAVKPYEYLKLNKDKVFIYQFDSKHSPNLIEKFVEEQKERTSMFRFLSDNEDEYFDDFDALSAEAGLEDIDSSSMRFKNFEDSKYKFSAFLSKLIKRRVVKGKGYKDNEADKILRYFKNSFLIKHYYFWEKLLTMTVVFDRPDLFRKLFTNIQAEINVIRTPDKSEYAVTADEYKNTLKTFLRLSISMAVGFDPQFINGNKSMAIVLEKYFESLFSVFPIDQLYIFRNVCLLRNTFSFYPLLPYTIAAHSSSISLIDANAIYKAGGGDKLAIKSDSREYLPVRVKFWQAALLMYYKNLLNQVPRTTENEKRWYNDRFGNGKILDEAFELFADINNVENREVIKGQYFSHKYDENFLPEYPDSDINHLAQSRFNNSALHEVHIPYNGEKKETIRVCIVNKYVSFADFEKSVDGHPNTTPTVAEVFDNILDDVSLVKNCDLFILPELSLPHRFLDRYTEQVERRQIGFVSGIEHLNYQNVAYNFVITVLPVVVDSVADAIPVLRLKNHYAPEEEAWLREKRKIVPKPNPYRYDLFIWRGFYFSTYYCYELADIFHRNAFYSKVDAIFAPVWNQDTHYYNNLIDAATRDMHCYFVVVNTAQYGFSKIARPRDHVNKEKVLVKGGTQKDYTFTLLVGDLKIKDLREFQSLEYLGQKRLNGDKSSFKPTPPDFPQKNVTKRSSGSSILIGD